MVFKSLLLIKLKKATIKLTVDHQKLFLMTDHCDFWIKTLRESRECRDGVIAKLFPVTCTYVNKLFQCFYLKKKRKYSHKPIGEKEFPPSILRMIFNEFDSSCLITYQNL